MFDQFKAFVSQFVQLQENEFQAIVNIAHERKIQKKEHLISAGEFSKQFVFFTEGYFRFYHYSSEGIEITSDFYFSPNFVTSYTSFLTGQPSAVCVQAMENINLLVFSFSDMQDLFSKYHNLEKLGRLIAEQVAITSERHLFSLLNQTAEERYKNLLDHYPQFIQHIPLQYIASYLGIKQETLSRVRKKIR